MKFKIGDKVRFLNEVGEGMVSRIINKNTLGVTIEDGFELPFGESELVSIFDGTQTEDKKEHEVIQEHSPVHFSGIEKRKEIPEGVYLALSPEKVNDVAHSDFNLWFVNHSSYEATYAISSLASSGFYLIDKGDLKPFEAKLAETISKKSLDALSNLKVEVLFYKTKNTFEHQSPVSEIVKIKIVKLYKENTFIENSLIPDNAYILSVKLFGEELYFDSPESKKVDLSKILLQKRSSSSKEKISKPHRKNNPEYEMEIDIHIEELADSWKGMSNAEIINVQLRHFQNALDKAISEHYRTLTIIHGVGNGRLKQEVRDILTKMNLRFHDGSYSKYGFGATEVVLN